MRISFPLKISAALAVLLSLAMVAAPAAAESSYKNREGKIQVGAGVGMSVSPLDVVTGIEAQFFPADSVSIGPRLSFIPAQRMNGTVDETIFLMMLDLRFHPDLGGKNNRFKPYVGIGGGLSFIDYDAGPVDDLDISPTIEFGVGADYFIADNVALGTQAHMVLPIDSDFGVLDEDVLLEWQVIRFNFIF